MDVGGPQLELFVPGRVALLGEHSDWASGHRKSNSKISIGAAIVVGTNQGKFFEAEVILLICKGIHATVQKLEERIFEVQSLNQFFSCPLKLNKLLACCKEGIDNEEYLRLLLIFN
jgi:hypothetical protein